MSDYSEKITNSERAIVLEDVYKNRIAKIVIPTITPSLRRDKPVKTLKNAPSPSNVVSGVSLALNNYYETNYIELMTTTKLYRGDTVYVNSVDDATVEKMSIAGEYYDGK